MPMDSTTQTSFNMGELGPYVEGRVDIETYKRALKLAENWIVLPQGGLQRRPGFEFVEKVGESGDNALQISLRKFDFGLDQQYLLVFRHLDVVILKDKLVAATVPTPYAGAEVRDLRMAQSGDSLIIVHPDHAPRVLERLGSDTAWGISEIEYDAINFFRFNLEQSLTPSGTSGAIALTLDPADAYWTAEHIGVRIRVNPDNDNKAYAEIDGFVQNATGGTPLSSAGTASNAFDGNDATTCAAGSLGWIGYAFSAATAVRVVGIKSVTSATVDLVYEIDDNDSFTSPSEIVAYEGLELVTDEWVYINVPDHTGETRSRIRLSDGTLEVKEVVFNVGVAVKATVGGANLANTNADEAWKEEAWSAAHGYPRSVTFHQSRLVYGGTRDAPDSIFASKTGDFYNFDDAKTDDAYGFAFTISSDQQQLIRDLKSQSDSLKIFASGGEFNMNSGDSDALGPTSVRVDAESNNGIGDVPVTEVDSILIFATANGKEIRSFEYDVGRAKYGAYNFTRVAHHLFDRGRFPLATAYLRSFKDTQSNYLFVPREDGEMAVFGYVTDGGNRENDIIGWSRWTTDGWFTDACVVKTDHGDGYKIDTLYALIERDTGIFIEALTEDKVFVDHWYIGASETAKATWSGLRTLFGEELQVVADGFVQPNVTVQGKASAANVTDGGTGYTLGDVLTVLGGDGTAVELTVTGETGGGIDTVSVSGEGDYTMLPDNPVTVSGGTGSGAEFNLVAGVIEIASPVENIIVGLGYQSLAETLDLTIFANGKTRRGDEIVLKEAILKLQETLSLTVQGRPIRFRNFDSGNFNDPLTEFNGTKSKAITGRGTDLSLTLTVDEPLQCTVLNLTTEYKVFL
ncbi:hypothetical protein [Ferrovibrio sp.]|uniref:hypothetical protein n=1 Tax=Ferrovibrio sp. TaxID=1917215 RepID=UPI0035B4D562